MFILILGGMIYSFSTLFATNEDGSAIFSFQNLDFSIIFSGSQKFEDYLTLFAFIIIIIYTTTAAPILIQALGEIRIDFDE